MRQFKPAQLILANGAIFAGIAPLWQQEDCYGEVVFNTGMIGYEETLTDPSYSGQILTFTYPILGNYGVSNGMAWESNKIHVKAVICATVFDQPAHHSSEQSFLAWLAHYRIPLISGVDTRELTKVLREYGVLNGVITYKLDLNKPAFNQIPAINWVEEVSPAAVEMIGSGRYKIILVDCGAKANIIRCLMKFDVTIKRVPFDYDYSDEEYDGIVLSNGPGDPKQCQKTVKILTKALQRNKPLFGICLGLQLLALAIGADTFKLKYGHRGHNQPCIDVNSQRCYLTSQNHSYAVDEKTLPADWQITFRHLNDHTVAGIHHVSNAFSAVQFHPEASSGPQDTFYLFEQFYQQIVAGGQA